MSILTSHVFTASPAPPQQEALRLLRQTLAGKFPEAHTPLTTLPPEEEESANAFSVTHPQLSEPLLLLKGELTEAYGDIGSASLLMEAILRSIGETRTLMALVDARSSFDPTLPPSQLARLLWIMAQSISAALKATDLLLRDGNLPLILLDLQLCSPEELRRVPSTTWYRFQRILEPTGTSLLVFTPQPMISSAVRRIAMEAVWELPILHQRRDTLPLNIRVKHRRLQTTPAWRQSA